jgi:nucleotide-binding universal stress UspA family protein
MSQEVAMYKRILVPLDGSELAERSLPYVKRIARRLNSEVILMIACQPIGYPELPLKAYLQKKLKELHSAGIRISHKLARGDAATKILDFAEKNDVNLIIMSTHGGSGVGHWPLGSCTSKVLQKTHVPTLLIRSSKAKATSIDAELKRVLVALDGSHFSEAIIPYVEGLVEGTNNEVILLRIVEPVKLPFTAGYIEHEKYEKEITAKAEEETKKYLHKKKELLRSKGINTSTALLKGHAASAILQYAESNAVSLIAITTHGFSGISKWAYGSVATNIIEGSAKPILLFRPQLPSANQ